MHVFHDVWDAGCGHDAELDFSTIVAGEGGELFFEVVGWGVGEDVGEGGVWLERRGGS